MKIMVVGAGGINSWFIHHVSVAIELGQIPASTEFHIYDDDTVETKNLKYQNFVIEDILEGKAKTIADRYGFYGYKVRVTDPSLFNAYDIVVCGVDNSAFRRMMFTYMDAHPEKYWIDMRAEGRTVGFYTRHQKNTLAVLLATLPQGEDTNTSCQLAYELESGVIQYGNKIIAPIGCQLLLNHLRGEFNSDSFTHRF